MKFLFMGVFIFSLIFQGPNLMAYDKNDYYRALELKKCINCDLYRAGFSGVDLSNADFSGSNLIGANFQNATLYKANLTNANISGANFEGALWTDGQICQKGSYGKCLRQAQ